jgi:hypothetical protein
MSHSTADHLPKLQLPACLAAVLVLSCLASIQAAGQKGRTLEALIVFGDSNSDVGNASFARYSFYKQTGLPDINFDKTGRFSGAPVWTDYVNECLPVRPLAWQSAR